MKVFKKYINKFNKPSLAVNIVWLIPVILAEYFD
jgi:hypothetical protein